MSEQPIVMRELVDALAARLRPKSDGASSCTPLCTPFPPTFPQGELGIHLTRSRRRKPQFPCRPNPRFAIRRSTPCSLSILPTTQV